jgi:hypothetical protein
MHPVRSVWLLEFRVVVQDSSKNRAAQTQVKACFFRGSIMPTRAYALHTHVTFAGFPEMNLVAAFMVY